MELKDAVELAFQRCDALQTFWNFYLTVFLGIIAFLAAANLPANRMRSVAWVITIGFVLFAVINLGGLHKAARQRFAAEDLVQAIVRESGSSITKTREFKYLVDTIKPSPVWRVAAIQICGDLFLLGFIWWRLQT